jgi:hypothetical protein
MSSISAHRIETRTSVGPGAIRHGIVTSKDRSAAAHWSEHVARKTRNNAPSRGGRRLNVQSILFTVLAVIIVASFVLSMIN